MDLELVIDALWDGSPARADEIVRVRLTDGGDHLVLHVQAPYHGDAPPEEPPGPLWGLWNHEVVELFILGVGQPEPYLEVEVGPHGHHVVITLVGQRQVTQSCLPLDLTTAIDGDQWTATARIPRSYLPFGASRINAYAIHGPREDRRYLAWRPVPGDGPDFHRIEHFVQVALP